MFSRVAFVLLSWGAGAPIVSGQALEIYRVQHRPVADLVRIAEQAMGSEGLVTLDSRTATLILSGSPAAVERALALLSELDRPLRHVNLRYQMSDASNFEILEARVAWQASLGPVRIGTLSSVGKGGLGDGVRIGLSADRGSTRVRSGSSLKVLEGSSGLIRTGEAFPFIYQPYYGTTATEFLPAETGLEATATVLGDGKVQLDLRPVSGRVDETGALRYTEAATSLIVAPGETVVFANVSSDASGESVGLDGGSQSSHRQNQVLLVSVEVEEP
jgi:type II secretory pathway component GspD/PulD (secretin)